ncbi:MAG: hypothetical protein K2M60_02505 [Lachnospiraceae bacterium]|nr:hypothetical protein [Lachnospiraceae bacterium]MDE6253251.1 hypothetical protein [Lachnospiraceae bacterium]
MDNNGRMVQYGSGLYYRDLTYLEEWKLFKMKKAFHIIANAFGIIIMA